MEYITRCGMIPRELRSCYLITAGLTSKLWGYARLGLWIQTLGKFWITIDSELTCSLLAPEQPLLLSHQHSRYSSNTIFMILFALSISIPVGAAIVIVSSA